MTTHQLKLNREDVLKTLGEFLAMRGQHYSLDVLGCFGSIARDEGMADSDVDIVYQVTPSARLTLFDLALMRDELIDLLGHPVDLIEFREQMPVRLRERLRQEAIYV
jgi:predicted nucleotidyltransferase